MNSNNLVSIIVTTFNSEKFIHKTISSIFSQSYKNWELIIVDDFSQDNTANILNKTLKGIKTVKIFYNKKNIGCNESRNLGIKNSKGRFIAFLDHDDYWLPDKLKLQLEFHSNLYCSASCTAYRRFNKKGNIGKLIKNPMTIKRYDLLLQNNIGFSSVMIDKFKIKNFNMINYSLSDFPTWLNLINNKHSFLALNQDLMRYFYDNSTDSNNKFKIAGQRWHVLRKIESISIIESSFIMAIYVIKSILKYRSL